MYEHRREQLRTKFHQNLNMHNLPKPPYRVRFKKSIGFATLIIVASMMLAFALLFLQSPLDPEVAAQQSSASSNANLKELSGGLNETIEPEFSPQVTEYTVQIPASDISDGASSIYLEIEAAERSASLKVESQGRTFQATWVYTIPIPDLSVATVVTVTVTAPDGVTKKVYTLTTVPSNVPTPTPTPAPTATPVATATPVPTATPTPIPTLTPTTTAVSTATVATTPTVTATPDASVKFVEPQCGPAMDMGAARAQGGMNRQGLEVERRYPKLGGTAFEDTVVMYEDAILEGQRPKEALDRIARRLRGYDIRAWTRTLHPGPEVQDYMPIMWVSFDKTMNPTTASISKVLKGFFQKHGMSGDATDWIWGQRSWAINRESSDPEEYADRVALPIPLGLIGKLSNLPEIESMTFPFKAYHPNPVSTNGKEIDNLPASVKPTNIPLSSESMAARWHGADVWHKAGYTGKGIKIGVIDGDFDRVVEKAGEGKPLPPLGEIKFRCFDNSESASTSVRDCDRDMTSHGTTVAEAVMNIAPDAKLYISNGWNGTNLTKIVDWMIEEGVHVINYSASVRWEGPGDGTYWQDIPYGISVEA